jgi:hypothetical protein
LTDLRFSQSSEHVHLSVSVLKLLSFIDYLIIFAALGALGALGAPGAHQGLSRRFFMNYNALIQSNGEKNANILIICF